jgi:two-component system chemotaxis response regulator CheB
MNSLSARAPRSTIATNGKVRVLIVDDSVVIRHLLREALKAAPEVEVVGAEANGVSALASIPVLKPDLVTLDIEMPQMDGLETLRHIRKDHPHLRTLMFSTLTTRGAAATFEALSLGADDYVAKASNVGKLDESLANLRSELLPKIRQFFAIPDGAVPKPHAVPAIRRRQLPRQKPKVLAIGVSTGGPDALAKLIPAIPGTFPLPILVVQHMPPIFTNLLSERLDGLGQLRVREAEDEMEVAVGRVIVARGDHHLRLRKTGSRVTCVLDRGPHENSCRPAVDVLFRSVAEIYGSAVLCVVLTGMGSDGRRGTEVVKAAGGYSIVQDQATSVVWGMPGAVAEAGLADEILPLSDIPAGLIRLTEQ